MRRWLVSLALAVVALPSAQAGALRVELADHAVTTTTHPLVAWEPRIAQLPAAVELDARGIIVTVGARKIRHALGRRGGLAWVAAVGSHVIAGYADRAVDHADTVAAIDVATGQLAWQRRLDSRGASELAGDLLAIAGDGLLEIVDARTGRSLDAAPIAGRDVCAVCRGDDLYVKTEADLVAIARTTGTVRWAQPTTARGNAIALAGRVIDGWVDRRANRFGVIAYDARSGRKLDSLELGETGGWYDHEHIALAPDGPREVLVTAAFGVG
jgi:hypothetical protein